MKDESSSFLLHAAPGIALKKVLIANRGEIAVRIVRACRELGLGTVAVYSACDRGALHTRSADEAHPVGGDPPGESYLRIDRLIDAASASGADAVHPGYGFLAENAAFARATRDAGLTFIGPSPDAIEILGSKTTARRLARAAGVPVVPGTDEPLPGDAAPQDAEGRAAEVGYPLLVKAVAGGGGKGMRLVGTPAELAPAVARARSEARSAFGDGGVYFERRLERPRHVEVQVLADAHGQIVPFVERECSIQRRHQKLVEESPSRAVSRELRATLTDAAAAVARAAGYVNAGTVEFLLDESGAFYFLEMNTRLQVEHPVTELVTGVDLVEWQIRIARGERLSLDADRCRRAVGHAVECRLYAEDPDRGFMPAPGRVRVFRPPAGPGVRHDSGVEAGDDVPLFYDALMSKLIVWARDRPSALDRLGGALAELRIEGVPTTAPLFRWLLGEPAFRDGAVHTAYLDEILAARDGQPFESLPPDDVEVAVIAAALDRYFETQGARAFVPGGDARSSPWLRAARLAALR